MPSRLRVRIRFHGSHPDPSRSQTTQPSFQRTRFSSTDLAGLTVDEFGERTSACRSRTLPPAAPEYLYARFPIPRLRESASRGWFPRRNRCRRSHAVLLPLKSVSRPCFQRLIPLALVTPTSRLGALCYAETECNAAATRRELAGNGLCLL